MLCGYVLLAAEAATYQLVFHNHTVRIPAQHDGYFLPGIVDALVCGIYLADFAMLAGGKCCFIVLSAVDNAGLERGIYIAVGRGYRDSA